MRACLATWWCDRHGAPSLLVTLVAMAALVALVSSLGCGSDKPSSFGAWAEELSILPQAASIQGRDGGPSGLAWGRSVWTFGDTVLAEADEQGTNWHNNSFSVTVDVDASDGIGPFAERQDRVGAPRAFIDATDDEELFNVAHRGNPCAEPPCGARWAVWPGAPLWDAAGGRALVFYGLIYAEPGAYNFRGVGSSLAVWTDFEALPQRPVMAPGAAHPTLMFGEGEPSWGAGALIDGELLYVFACDGDPFAPGCTLARVPAASALERRDWRFWDGTAWSTAMEARRPLFAGAPTISVAFNQHLQAWVAIYAQPLSTDVVIRSAPALTGPWSSAKLLFQAVKKDGGAYDATWHSEYGQEGGKVLYVTYSRSTGVGWFGSEFAIERVVLP